MNKNSYNKVAHKWAEKRKKTTLSKLVIDFADNVIAQGKILDIGCGAGIPIATYLSERGFFITGIDFSEEMIAMALLSNIANTQFINCNFLDFETTEKFNGVIAWDSLWHFPKDKQKSIYPKIGNLLKPGGYLIFTHGNIDGEHFDSMLGESFYYSSLSKDKVLDILSENGFEIIYAYEDFVEEKSHRAFVVLAKKIQ